MSSEGSLYQRLKKKRSISEEESMMKFYEPINSKEMILDKYIKQPEK
jgi:hypothetical protein